MDPVRASPCRPAANIDAMRRAVRPDTRKRSARRLGLDKAEPVSLGASTHNRPVGSTHFGRSGVLPPVRFAVIEIQYRAGFVRSADSMESLWTILVGAFGWAADPGHGAASDCR